MVEVLVGSAILSLVLFAFTSSLSIYSAASIDATRRTQALFLAEEGVELLRSMRDQSWSNIGDLESITLNETGEGDRGRRLVKDIFIGPIVYGETPLPSLSNIYGFEFNESQNKWHLVKGKEELAEFTREVVIYDIYRNAQDDISDAIGGVYYDEGTRLVSVKVSWPSRRGVQSLALESLLTDTAGN